METLQPRQTALNTTYPSLFLDFLEHTCTDWTTCKQTDLSHACNMHATCYTYMYMYCMHIILHAHTLGYDSFIVVGIDAHTVALQVKSILTEFGMAELVLVEVRPAPDPSVDHMGKTLSSSDLD